MRDSFILRIFSKQAKEGQGEVVLIHHGQISGLFLSLFLIDKILKIIHIFTYDNGKKGSQEDRVTWWAKDQLNFITHIA